MRDTFEDDYAELIFEFEVALIFEAVHIYTNNYFSRDVQVGNFFTRPPLCQAHKPAWGDKEDKTFNGHGSPLDVAIFSMAPDYANVPL